MRENLIQYLLANRGEDLFFESRLSDSAVSTAVACVALEIADAKKYTKEIGASKKWLLEHQNSDGLWGDSPESPSNLTATFMGYIALHKDVSIGDKITKAKEYLLNVFGDFSFTSIKKGLFQKYGKDLTFSVPILAMANASNFFIDSKKAWRSMPQFPFEVVIFPEKFFHLLNLPVVSYAIPALISIGLAQHSHARKGLFKLIRSSVKKRAIHILTEKQPSSGGFLEAAPLTAFCTLCLCIAGLSKHTVTENALRFLLETQRSNGAWPIDHDLRQWVTSLSTTVLAEYLSEDEKALYRDKLKAQQTKTVHPFTKSAPGGWGWTTRSGSVPDADDTAAALISLHSLGEGTSQNVCEGIKWLLKVQNRDGGIPTFCKGWGKLPFDKSTPDLSAHAFKALSLFEKELPNPLRKKVQFAMKRILKYLASVQHDDGSFIPLWFGDQNAKNKTAPVYGSAVVLEHLYGCEFAEFLDKTKEFLLKTQHKSGGWGSVDSEQDYVIFTARCVKALKPFKDAKMAVSRAIEFLKPYIESPETLPNEPIGLYFAHLWYDENLYAPIFLSALGDVYDY